MDRREHINAVQRMQSYIEAHLQEPITLHMLAGAAGYSPWHAAKIFKALTGKSPFEYIRAVRLSRAAVRLRDEERQSRGRGFRFCLRFARGLYACFFEAVWPDPAALCAGQAADQVIPAQQCP